jgi:hypothetical protein
VPEVKQLRGRKNPWLQQGYLRGCLRKNGDIGVKDQEILTRIVAVYGAILSTTVVVRQFLNERVRVTVTVKRIGRWLVIPAIRTRCLRS